MKWSAKEPVKEGWYWHRFSEAHCSRVMRIKVDPSDGTLCVEEDQFGNLNFIQNYEGEWAGPIPEPKEEA